MKLKRILAICLLLCMMLGLAACGDEGVPYVPPTVGTRPTGNTGNVDGPEEPDGPGKVEELTSWQKFNTTVTTDKHVLTTEVGATITIDPVTYDEVDAGLKITLDNSSEQTLYADVKMAAVNGVMLDAGTSVTADAGESGDTTLWLSQDQMRLNAIFNIKTIDLVLSIYDEEWDQLKQLEVTIGAKVVAVMPGCEDFYDVITNEAAQKDLAFELLDATRAEQALGKDVYLKTKAMVQYEYESTTRVYLELENRSQEAKYLDVTLQKLNGLEHYWDWDYGYMLPDTTMLISFVVGGNFGEGMMVKAFGMEEIAQMEFAAEVYDCDENYEMDFWAEDTAHNIVTYNIPDTEVTLDMSATVIYDNGQIRISSKEAVTNEYNESYIFLIFEVLSNDDYYVEDHPDRDVTVEGEDCYVYFDTPGWIEGKGTAITYLEVDNTKPVTVDVPVMVTNWDTDEESFLSLLFDLE